MANKSRHKIAYTNTYTLAHTHTTLSNTNLCTIGDSREQSAATDRHYLPTNRHSNYCARYSALFWFLLFGLVWFGLFLLTGCSQFAFPFRYPYLYRVIFVFRSISLSFQIFWKAWNICGRHTQRALEKTKHIYKSASYFPFLVHNMQSFNADGCC